MADSDSGSLQEVVQFLESSLRVAPNIIVRFQKEKIDKEAVNMMSEKDLQDMGLVKGELLKLQAFCRRDNTLREDRLKALKKIIEEGKDSRKPTPKNVEPGRGKTVSNKAMKATLKFEFRWKHEINGHYKLIREGQGGGVRKKDIPRNSTAYECLKVGQDFFFPDGKNNEGELDDMVVNLADFKGDIIDLMGPFTAESYKAQNGLHTPRLILLTKEKFTLVPESPHVSSDEDESELSEIAWSILPGTSKLGNKTAFPNKDSVIELDSGGFEEESPSTSQSPPVHLSPKTSTLIGTSSQRKALSDSIEEAYATSLAIDKTKRETKEANARAEKLSARREGFEEESPSTSQSPTVHLSPKTSTLIGTSSERKALSDSIEEAYTTSLAIDKTKRETKEANARAEKLRARREGRVAPVPEKNSPYFTISVRHPHLGVQTRPFSPGTKMLGVYDWIGSLSSFPEHFSLVKVFPRETIYPEVDVSDCASTTLCMISQDTPIPLSADDNEVHLAYCGDSDDALDTTEVDYPSGIPDQLMEDDKPPTQAETCAAEIDKRRRSEYEKLGSHSVMRINRQNCLKEMMDLYRQEDILKSNVLFLFNDEEAVGEGVRKDVYSAFWDAFTTRYCDGVTQLTFSLSPELTVDDYTVLGRIISHQFIQTGAIPVQLVETILQLAVVGQVTDECLLESFMMILHEKERQMIKEALDGDRTPFPTNDLVDILSQYNSGTLPTKDNLHKALLQAANIELVSKPYMCIIKLREGMGSFWNDVSAQEIHSLYMCCAPTVENLLNNIYFSDCTTSQEEKVERWLKRYIKNLDNKMLIRFVRFTTGNEIILPQERIKIEMEHMSECAMRPKSRICFKVFTLPKNYTSYSQMRDNLDCYLLNQDSWNLHDL